CHDHKFDPITAKDFYSMYAFFYSIDGPAMDGNALLTAPTMKAATKAQEVKLNEFAARIAKAQSELAEKLKALPYADPADAKEPNKAAGDPKHSFKAWRTAAAKDAKGVPKELIALVKQAKLDAAGETRLREHYLQNV